MKELNFHKIGSKLREARLSQNLTQEYIAFELGINTSHISNIENNRVKISLTTLVNMCNILNITVDYALSDEYNNPSSAIEHSILHELHSCHDKTKEKILQIIKILQ